MAAEYTDSDGRDLSDYDSDSDDGQLSSLSEPDSDQNGVEENAVELGIRAYQFEPQAPDGDIVNADVAGHLQQQAPDIFANRQHRPDDTNW
jgi:hypothetical protein